MITESLGTLVPGGGIFAGRIDRLKFNESYAQHNSQTHRLVYSESFKFFYSSIYKLHTKIITTMHYTLDMTFFLVFVHYSFPEK